MPVKFSKMIYQQHYMTPCTACRSKRAGYWILKNLLKRFIRVALADFFDLSSRKALSLRWCGDDK